VKVELREITRAEIPAAATFLHAQLNSRVSAETWAASMVPPWRADAPNHGYLLRREGEVVGVHLAFYSRRVIDGEPQDFCNLGAWCVDPEYRFQSLRLLQALLKQKGYTFTDLSPSGDVVPLNEKLGFEDLDTATALVPNLPWPTIPGRARIVSDPARIERLLTGRDLEIYRDHEDAAAARHLVVQKEGKTCYVVFRRVRRKNLPVFGSVLYVSDPAVLAGAMRSFTRHLLLRHGLLVTLAEAHVVPHPPAWSKRLNRARRKMYKSARLGPRQIDNLYSELVCVPW
jgi:hypothetical protein